MSLKRRSSENPADPSAAGGRLSLDGFLSTLESLPSWPRRLWVAFSGGLDSTVLLDLVAQSIPKLRGSTLAAIHVHHQLQAVAEDWPHWCQSVCDQSSVPLTVIRVNAAHKPGQSPEEAAREARQGAFLQVLEAGDALLLAHHQDDQAETLLLQLLRGAGAEGLAGMPVCQPLGAGHVLRPFLNLPRATLVNEAHLRKLRWIEDPSNQDLQYRRNHLRHTIMPELMALWPSVSRCLARSSQHLAETARYLAQRERDLAERVSQGVVLSSSALETLPAYERRLALRGWLRLNGLRPPSTRQLNEIERSVFGAKADRRPTMRLSQGSLLVRHEKALCLIPIDDNPRPECWPNPEEPLSLSGSNGTLRLIPDPIAGWPLDVWRTQTVLIQYRRGGESIRLGALGKEARLKDLFQSKGLSPWLRERMPLIRIQANNDSLLVSVGGLWNRPPPAPSPIKDGFSPLWIPPEGLDPLDSLGLGFSVRPQRGNETRQTAEHPVG